MLVLFLVLLIESTPSKACEAHKIPSALVRLVSHYHHVGIIGAANGERTPVMLPQTY
jgi:hypothetical protein